MYSTCTFSPVENEGLISYVLEQFPEMELLEIIQPGRIKRMSGGTVFFPIKESIGNPGDGSKLKWGSLSKFLS